MVEIYRAKSSNVGGATVDSFSSVLPNDKSFILIPIISIMTAKMIAAQAKFTAPFTSTTS
jgi:hypothetical protein